MNFKFKPPDDYPTKIDLYKVQKCISEIENVIDRMRITIQVSPMTTLIIFPIWCFIAPLLKLSKYIEKDIQKTLKEKEN